MRRGGISRGRARKGKLDVRPPSIDRGARLMRCPECSSEQTRVLRTKAAPRSVSVQVVRELACEPCGLRWQTTAVERVTRLGAPPRGRGRPHKSVPASIKKRAGTRINDAGTLLNGATNVNEIPINSQVYASFVGEVRQNLGGLRGGINPDQIDPGSGSLDRSASSHLLVASDRSGASAGARSHDGQRSRAGRMSHADQQLFLGGPTLAQEAPVAIHASVPPAPPDLAVAAPLLRLKRTPAVGPDGRSRYPAEFESFWAQSDKTGGKLPAWRAWTAAGAPAAELLLRKRGEYLASKEPGSRFITHVATWLNARGWEDDYQPFRSRHPASGLGHFSPRSAQDDELPSAESWGMKKKAVAS